jgi:TRAP-type C4-dicarboxylate transport system permease small subunit
VRFTTNVIDRITTAMAIVAGIAVALMMIHTTISIIARSGFDYALTGTITIVSNYYMIIVVCLPLAWVERNDAHISVDVLTNHFSRSAQARLFGWTYLLSALVFALVAYASWEEAVTKYNLGLISVERDIAIPTWVGYFAVPLGYGMGTVYALLRFVRFLAGRPQNPVAGGVDSQVERLSYD